MTGRWVRPVKEDSKQRRGRYLGLDQQNQGICMSFWGTKQQEVRFISLLLGHLSDHGLKEQKCATMTVIRQITG